MTLHYRLNGRLVGLLLIIAGVLLLVGTFFSVTLMLTRLIWPGILIALGLHFLSEQLRWTRHFGRRMPFPWPIFLVAWGAAGILKVLGIWSAAIPFWPLILVAIGLWMLWNRW